jgi:hypothetical protein
MTIGTGGHAGRASVAAATALALLTAACGSSGPAAPPHRRAAAVERPPSNLVGTYTTTLARSDLPAKPPPELTGVSRTWKLTIASSGGPSAGPALTITNADAGLGQSLESSALRVRGHTLLLHDEVCDAGGSQALYDNAYAYRLTGRALTLRTVRNRCADDVAQTILTSQPWKRTGR